MQTKFTQKSLDKKNALVEKYQAKFPSAAWSISYDDWNKAKYRDETAQELLDLYGVLSHHDQHVIALLAEQMDCYMECSKLVAEQGVTYAYNGGKTMGPSPAFQMRLKSLEAATSLMKELNLTLKSRGDRKPKEDNDIESFLKGPKA